MLPRLLISLPAAVGGAIPLKFCRTCWKFCLLMAMSGSLWQPPLCRCRSRAQRQAISSKEAELDWNWTKQGRRVKHKMSGGKQQVGNIGSSTRLLLICLSFSASAPALSMAAGVFLFLQFPSFILIPGTLSFTVIPSKTHGWTDFNLMLWQEGTECLKVAAICTTLTLLLCVLANILCETAL